jgi:hypothetical protein
MFVVVGFAIAVPTASAQCTGKDCPPPCTKDCPPPVKDGICHNIGGPRDLGANCDGTGNCSFTTDTGQTLHVAAGQFLGIIIGFNQDSAGALAAHIAHGDGPILMTWDPALHLASTGQNHEASNVECLGARIVPQPPDPGN